MDAEAGREARYSGRKVPTDGHGAEVSASDFSRLHHCRDIGENVPFEFLIFFDYADADTLAFDDLVAALPLLKHGSSLVERSIFVSFVLDDCEPATALEVTIDPMRLVKEPVFYMLLQIDEVILCRLVVRSTLDFTKELVGWIYPGFGS